MLAVGAAGPAAAAQRRWTPAAFQALQTDVAATLELVPAVQASVLAEAEPKVLERLRVEVRAGVLHLESVGAWQTQQPVTLRVGYATLESLRLGGTVEARVQGPRAPEFELRCSDSAGVELRDLDTQSCRVLSGGSGTVRLAGRCQRLAVEANGSGDVLAAGLAAQDARVRAGGSATVEVAAAAALNVHVAGAATVRYKGKPRLIQQVGDAGTLETL
jgi:hypothetical protein